MLSITGSNVNEVFYKAILHFKACSLIESKPRGERRLQYPTPVASMYLQPMQRVLFSPARDANPFFHFMESLWIIGGRADVAWLEQWLKRIKEYSDNGKTFHGAYGARIRRHGQLASVLHRLRTEKDTTRAVLQIYDAIIDSDYTGKDMPCNCTIFFGLQNNKLNITVANRSNDMIWGAYGANVVQFSMLQEYMAGVLGCEVGWYVQISNNAHIYPDNEATKRVFDALFQQILVDPYEYQDVKPMSLGVKEDPELWNHELHLFLQGWLGMYKTPFFATVANPMRMAHTYYRQGNLTEAIGVCGAIAAEDWSLACYEWLQRREKVKQ